MLDFGNKIENGGQAPYGTVSAAEINAMVAAINANESGVEDLDGRAEAAEDMLGVASYTVSDLTANAYYVLTGVFAPVSTREDSYWKCMKFEVKAGQRITVGTLGGRNARAYALTDKSRKILSVAEANADTTSSPVVLNVAQDGYCYVNYKTSGNKAFSVEVSISVTDALAEDIAAPRYHNNPLPLWEDTLRVLAIGNSFTDDGTYYLADLVDATSIDQSKLCVYVAVQSGSSLEDWAGSMGETKTLTRRAGTLAMNSSGTMAELLAQDWDVIVIQQVSSRAASYNTYNPYLTQLVMSLRRYCTNQQVAIAWQSVWSYKTGISTNGYECADDEAMWSDLRAATKTMMRHDGIDIIIPTGTAIQNARNTTLNTNGDMTRDGQHLAHGVGRYIAACTWFQTLIAPMFGVSVLGNTATRDVSGDSSTYAAVSVTASNRGLCQECAFAAVIDMWNVTEVE